MGEIEARPENAFELAMDGRCGQGTLHQPGSKTATCNISSNVAGTGSTEMLHQTLDGC